MVFSSVIFLGVFLPIVLFFYYIVFRNHRTLQNIFLLLASLAFYAWGEPAFVLIMIVSIFCNWVCGLLVDRQDKWKSIGLVGAIIINISIIFVFKYLTFVMENVKNLTGADFSIPEIALPIGISFFTFQGLSYVIDVYRKNGEVQKNPLNVGLYIALFPQLIAGPIVRYETVAYQIRHRKENMDLFSSGVVRFLGGLAKKVLLANNLALLATAAFSSDLTQISTGYAWLGAVAFSFQILFDFSGYSDMAIGLGRMFGFEFLENFDYPYISTSVSEFWRRWHISLGSWFRDYVYFPLGGSRVDSKFRLVFNLFVVWLLTGVWHGANWTFIAWGLLYFVLLTVEKLTGYGKKKHAVLGRIYTLFFVQIGWVLFNSPTIGSAIQYLKVMFGVGGTPVWDNTAYFNLCEYGMYFVFAILFSMPIFSWLKTKTKNLEKYAIYRFVVDGGYLAAYVVLFILVLSFMAKSAYNPFIYFNF